MVEKWILANNKGNVREGIGLPKWNPPLLQFYKTWNIYHGWKWVRHTEDDFVLGVIVLPTRCDIVMAWINYNLAFLTCEKYVWICTN